MLDLLAMCGFDGGESTALLPRMRRALGKLGIGDEDIDTAKIRLPAHYDLSSTGVRRLFGLFLLDLVDIALARDEGREKIVHACMAPGSEILGSVLRTHSKTVGFINPNFTYMVMLGAVFGKYVPVLEAAERQWLRTGMVAHCGMVKSRLGLLSLGLIPMPDLTITSGFTCETSPKTNELIEEFYGVPACYIDTCQDREAAEYPDARRATILAAKSMRGVSRRIQDVTRFEITDDMVWQALAERRDFEAAMGRVEDLIQNSDPLPLGSAHLNLLSVLGAMPFTAEEAARAAEVLDTLYDDLAERVARGVGVTPKGAPRVLTILPNHHCDPRLEHLANQMGIAIVMSDFQGSSVEGIDGAGVVDPSDPYDVIVQHLHGSLAQPLSGRIAIILDACRRLRIDGVLDHYHVGCRYVAGDALIIREAVQKELGIPVLLMEWENFDPRVYDHARREAELETFKGMLETAAARD